MPNVEKEDKIIDLPSDGPDTEVTLPEETVKEGAQEVVVPEVKPEGEVEVKEETPKQETETKELIQEEQKPEEVKEEAKEKELDNNDKIVGVKICKDDQDIILSTKLGKCIRFESKRLRVFKGRSSKGILIPEMILKISF